MFKSYLLLTLAIIFEVVGTLLLPLSNNFTKLIPTIGLTIFYISSFYFLTFALKLIPISIVYATWSGMGIFLITMFGYFMYHQASVQFTINVNKMASVAQKHVVCQTVHHCGINAFELQLLLLLANHRFHFIP